MKKSILFCSFLLLYSYLHLYSIHPRAQSAVISLQNQLQQLRLHYNPSLALGIQNTIDLLNVYDPSEARKFQILFEEIIKQQGNQQVLPTSRERIVYEPQPEPLPEIQPNKPITPPPLPETPQPAPPMPESPAAPTDIPQRPLPVIPVGETLKKQLTTLQQRTVESLQKYIPAIKGKKLDDMQSLVPTLLKEQIRALSGKNTIIKNNTKAILAGNVKALPTLQLPSIDTSIDGFYSIDKATTLYTILYGTQIAEPLLSYSADIKNDFVTVTFENAIARIRYIRNILNQMGSYRTAFNAEEINTSIDSLMKIQKLMLELQELHVVYLARYVQDAQNPNTLDEQLTTELQALFEAFNNIASHIKITFEDAYQDMSIPLKMLQRQCYELIASNIHIAMRMLIDPLSQHEVEELTQTMQSTLTQMTITILKLHAPTKK